MANATLTMEEMEAQCREFAAEFPTTNVLLAIGLCESGALGWDQIYRLFIHSLAEYGRLK